jgi:hypothetical protein
MKDAELNRILTASPAQPAPYPSLNLHARLISHRSPTKSKKGQATPWWPEPSAIQLQMGSGYHLIVISVLV